MFVTFITPAPWLRRLKPYQWGSHVYGTRDSITGPLILAGIAHRAGHHVEAYEELNGSFDMGRLVAETDVLCLYTMTSNAPRAYELADLFHAQGHARVLIGGIHASSMPEEAARHADQVIVGEGEGSFLDVLEGRLTDKVVRAKPVCDLDSLPWPDYSVLKTPVEAADIMTSRGCPFRCTFCTTCRMFAPYRKRSVDSVIAEIKHYHELGFEYMNFEDDNFTADKDRAKEICRRMVDEGLQFKETFFFGRTDMADDPELLDLLAAAHLNWVLIGIESLNQATLDAVNKHQSVEDIRRAGAACRDHGIQLIASIVLGADTDTHEDIMRSVQFAKDIDASKLQPAVLTPFPGTPLYEGYCREGRMLVREERDWQNFDLMNATYQPRNMSPWDLEMEFFHAATGFYDRKGALRMGRLFGPGYGLTRYTLAVFARLGKWGVWLASLVAPRSWYYRLRHEPWAFASEHEDDETGRELRRLRARDDAQGVAGTAAALAALAAPAAALVSKQVKKSRRRRAGGQLSCG